MTTKHPIRTIIEAAAEALETYRRPDIRAATQLIDEVLRAARIGEFADREDIDAINITEHEVMVTTTYGQGSGQCHYGFPASILDADNHVIAANTWRLQERVKTLDARVVYCRSNLDHAITSLADARTQLAHALSQDQA